MTKAEIMKLVDAGFTKDDIFKLSGDQFVPEQKPDNMKKKDPEPEKKTQEPDNKPDPSPAPQGVTLSDDQFTKLLQQLNVGGASLDIPPENDMATKLGEHFKDITIGT